jgi:D-arabinose 1-dehydrogenase-like Zn-dependent alcohol dehydrogenase
MENQTEKNFDHFLYQHCEEKEADAVAWAFVNKDEIVKFPFKYQEACGEDEIRANVLYCGLCQSDSLHCRGKWGYTMYPVVPGHEMVCQVSQVGTNATNYKVGDIVCFGPQRDNCEDCKDCSKGRENLCREVFDKWTYGMHFGGYATSIQQPHKFFFKLPEGMDEKRAAPLLCAGVTVYAPIKEHFEPGDKCGVIGIGGLGHLAIQFLAKMGANVTAFTSSSDKTDLLKSLGAAEVINYTDKNAMKGVRDSFDFIINCLSVEDGFNDFIEICAPRCKFIQVGLPDASKKLSFTANDFVSKEIRLTSSSVGTRQATRDMLDFCAKNDVYPMVEEYPFEELPKAFDKLENGRPKFRCVLNVVEYSKKNNLFK